MNFRLEVIRQHWKINTKVSAKSSWPRHKINLYVMLAIDFLSRSAYQIDATYRSLLPANISLIRRLI